MKYAAIKKCDIANGPGVRVSLFVSGCRNQCKGCFNREVWDFDYGDNFGHDAAKEIFDELKKLYVKGISILGGEPLDDRNVIDVYCLVVDIKAEFGEKNVWVYSGYTYEEIVEKGLLHKAVLNVADVLVDGRYVEEKRNISLQYRGSENQRIIDLRKTKDSGKIVLWKDV